MAVRLPLIVHVTNVAIEKVRPGSTVEGAVTATSSVFAADVVAAAPQLPVQVYVNDVDPLAPPALAVTV